MKHSAFIIFVIFTTIYVTCTYFLWTHPGITFSRERAQFITMRVMLDEMSLFVSSYLNANGDLPEELILEESFSQNYNMGNIEITYLILSREYNDYIIIIRNVNNNICVVEKKISQREYSHHSLHNGIKLHSDVDCENEL